MGEQKRARHYYKPTPQLTQFIDGVLDKRKWKSAGATAAAMAVLAHTGQEHLLVDEKGVKYTEQAIYELIRKRIEVNGASAGIRLVAAPKYNASLDTTLFELMHQLTQRLWAIADKGDADTLRDILSLVREA